MLRLKNSSGCVFPKYTTQKFITKPQSQSMTEAATRGVLRNFAKFTGKHLCQSLFFNKVAGAACNFIKKETLTQVFSCEFCEISKNTFFKEHLRMTASTMS